MRAHRPNKCTGLPTAGHRSMQQAPALRCKLLQGTGHRQALPADKRHTRAEVTDLQCSSIRLSEAPEVASSSGEVSRHRCMHCRGQQQQEALAGPHNMAGPPRHASTGCWRRQPRTTLSEREALHQAEAPSHGQHMISSPWPCSAGTAPARWSAWGPSGGRACPCCSCRAPSRTA